MKDKKPSRGGQAQVQALRRRVGELEAACKRLELTDQALRASEENWRSLTENAPDIIVTADREGTVLFVNHTLPGLTPDQVVGTSVYDYVPPEHHDTLKTNFERVFRTGEAGTYELVGIGPHGATAWYRSRIGPIERDGNTVGVTVVTRDITEEKKAEEALRASRQRLQDILDNTWDIIFEVDLEGNYTFGNKAAERVTGYPLEEVLRMNMRELVAPEYHEEVFQRMAKRIRGVSLPQPFDFDIVHRDGHRIHLELTTSGVERDGKLVAVQGIGRDVTQRKRAEEELRRSEEAERQFRGQLTALHETTVELSMAGSVDELCRRAVELGRSTLGFDRLGLWFTTDEPHTAVGSFGTDEQGNLRDERDRRVVSAEHPLAEEVIAKKVAVVTDKDVVICDLDGKPVGRGTRAVGALWDGDDVLGYLSTDNLLSRQEITANQRELLRLYASALGRLCSRKRAEEELRRSEEAERSLRARLTALHEVTVELSGAGSFDELCRLAVELGRSRLGFDRLGTWFLEEPPNTVRGGFGTDEHGGISDERSVTGTVEQGTLMWRAITEELPFGLIEDAELLNARGQVLGRGTLAMASLWDGERVIGCICTDNLLKGEPVTQADCEVLRLYASILGHLCSRLRAEEELLVKNSAIHSAMNAIALGDLDANVTYVNPSFLRLWGYDSEDEVVGKPAVSFWQVPERAEEVVEAVKAEGNWRGELVARRKDGTTFDVELSASMVADDAGQPICRMGSFVDVSERKRAERAMRAAQRKLMTAREEERRRLAGELHDSVGQGLIALQLTLEATLAEGSESSIAQGVERTRAQCDALIHEVRAIGRGLYPATLESMGLEAALRQLARDFESQAEVVVRWSEDCQDRCLTGEVEIALFRVGQEAVANAVRHGQAQRVELSLACPAGQAVFTVTDNGSGFDPDAAKGKGLGLTTMQERAEAVGGRLEIRSRPGQTIVRVRVPFEPTDTVDEEG